LQSLLACVEQSAHVLSIDFGSTWSCG
jgi:hypothetical protein